MFIFKAVSFIFFSARQSSNYKHTTKILNITNPYFLKLNPKLQFIIFLKSVLYVYSFKFFKLKTWLESTVSIFQCYPDLIFSSYAASDLAAILPQSKISILVDLNSTSYQMLLRTPWGMKTFNKVPLSMSLFPPKISCVFCQTLYLPFLRHNGVHK